MFKKREIRTFVHFNARDDAAGFEELRKWRAIVGLLVEGLVKEDHAWYVVGDGGISGEKELSVETTILGRVFYVDAVEAFVHAARGLVRGQDAFAWSDDRVSDSRQFLLLHCW